MVSRRGMPVIVHPAATRAYDGAGMSNATHTGRMRARDALAIVAISAAAGVAAGWSCRRHGPPSLIPAVAPALASLTPTSRPTTTVTSVPVVRIIATARPAPRAAASPMTTASIVRVVLLEIMGPVPRPSSPPFPTKITLSIPPTAHIVLAVPIVTVSPMPVSIAGLPLIFQISSFPFAHGAVRLSIFRRHMSCDGVPWSSLQVLNPSSSKERYPTEPIKPPVHKQMAAQTKMCIATLLRCSCALSAGWHPA